MIGEIASLNIGSRPASRTTSQKIEDLRAIHGLQLVAMPADVARLVWFRHGRPAFTARHGSRACAAPAEGAVLAVLPDAAVQHDMVLAKTNLAIASRYADLVEDRTLRAAIFERIATEMAHTTNALFAITGQSEPLAGNPLLARSIRNRSPISIR